MSKQMTQKTKPMVSKSENIFIKMLMALFNDMCCQTCDRFLFKKRWTKHLYSSTHLHREVNGYWPAYFPQR